jgi:hypothetical protein
MSMIQVSLISMIPRFHILNYIDMNTPVPDGSWTHYITQASTDLALSQVT